MKWNLRVRVTRIAFGSLCQRCQVCRVIPICIWIEIFIQRRCPQGSAIQMGGAHGQHLISVNQSDDFSHQKTTCSLCYHTFSVDFPTRSNPRSGRLSRRCSVFVLTLLAGTFWTSTNSLTRRILPAISGEWRWYTVCIRLCMPSETSVALYRSGRAMADRRRVIR